MQSDSERALLTRIAALEDSLRDVQAALAASANPQARWQETESDAEQHVLTVVEQRLPELIHRLSKTDSRIESAFAPVVERALGTSVKNDPKAVASYLFPVLGPAIRESFSRSLETAAESFVHALRGAMTLRGVRWWIEAWRTGKPFAEVARMHSLVFRVDLVMLVHAETGLLLAHSGRTDSDAAKDPDLVSAMLTVIREFARDTMGRDESDQLDRFDYGGMTVLVASGPLAHLVTYTHGVPPSSTQRDFMETLESIHADLGPRMREFDGDTTPFELIAPRLQACLVEIKRKR